MIEDLGIDILNIIYKKLNNKNKIKFRTTCKLLYNDLYLDQITNIFKCSDISYIEHKFVDISQNYNDLINIHFESINVYFNSKHTELSLNKINKYLYMCFNGVTLYIMNDKYFFNKLNNYYHIYGTFLDNYFFPELVYFSIQVTLTNNNNTLEINIYNSEYKDVFFMIDPNIYINKNLSIIYDVEYDGYYSNMYIDVDSFLNNEYIDIDLFKNDDFPNNKNGYNILFRYNYHEINYRLLQFDFQDIFQLCYYDNLEYYLDTHLKHKFLAMYDANEYFKNIPDVDDSDDSDNTYKFSLEDMPKQSDDHTDFIDYIKKIEISQLFQMTYLTRDNIRKIIYYGCFKEINYFMYYKIIIQLYDGESTFTLKIYDCFNKIITSINKHLQ